MTHTHCTPKGGVASPNCEKSGISCAPTIFAPPAGPPGDSLLRALAREDHDHGQQHDLDLHLQVRPEPVAEYVRRHMAVISGVTFREAVKYLPEPEQGELRAVYKAR